MSYIINLTDGSTFATVADGTINTTAGFSAQAPMVLVGKNYSGYGEFLNENYIHLLENGANTVPPGAPLTGQLWWDKSTGTMKVYTGTSFKIISSATAAAAAPTNNVTGDLWFDTVNQQLRVWNGSGFTLIGPASSSGSGTSGPAVATVIDNLSVPHVVIQFWIQNTLTAIMSRDATFTPQTALAGFATIAPGLQFSSAVANLLFRGTATDSNLLQGNPAANFMSAVSATQTTGSLSVVNNNGLRVGLNSDFAVTVAGTDVTVANQTLNGNVSFRVNVAGTPTTVIAIDGVTGVPTAPTAVPGTNTTQIATTAFATAAITAERTATANLTNKTLTSPTINTPALSGGTIANAAITGGSIANIADLGVPDGGTGVSSLAANSVVLGNGTSSLQTVAPGSNGNVLTSNGSTWASAAPLQPIGVGQTWQNMSSSRALSVTYTNNTGRPIQVLAGLSGAGAGNYTASILINGNTIMTQVFDFGQVFSFIVPNNDTYRIQSTDSLGSWWELR